LKVNERQNNGNENWRVVLELSSINPKITKDAKRVSNGKANLCKAKSQPCKCFTPDTSL
jgi:hypothetical protein